MFSRLSNGWKIVLQLVFVLLLCTAAIILLISMGLTKPASGSQRVHFRVEASGGAAIITFQAGSVTIKKPTVVTAPWSKTLQVPSGTVVYLTASNPTQTGKLTCSIILDKTPWKSETTNAPKDGVACAGIVP